MTVPVKTFVDRCISATGTPYVFGAKGPPPNPIDCSGLVSWASDSTGLSPSMPGGSWNQLSHCLIYGLGQTVQQGIDTYGALLFMGPGGSEHVAVSLGNGMTIEARGHLYGTGSWNSTGRPWSAAAKIPGVNYGASTQEDAMTPEQSAEALNILRSLAGLFTSPIGPGEPNEQNALIEDFRRLKNVANDIAAIKAKVGA